MVTESPLSVLSEMGTRDGCRREDVGLLFQEPRLPPEAADRENELDLFRSGSAPPTVEGSLSAIGGLCGGSLNGGSLNACEAKNHNGLLAEEELRSNPAYHSYYYSHVNLNPRLPPPLLSKEDSRSMQRFQVGSSGLGRIGDGRNLKRGCNERSLFSMQPGAESGRQGHGLEPKRVPSSGDGQTGLPEIQFGRYTGFCDSFQDGPDYQHTSHQDSSNSYGTNLLGSSEAQFASSNKAGFTDSMQPGSNVQRMSGIQSNDSSEPRTYASILGSSISRSASPDPHFVRTAPSPRLPPVGVRLCANDKRSGNVSCSFDRASADAVDSDDLVAALSGINLSAAQAVAEDNIHKSKVQQDADNCKKFLFGEQWHQSNTKQCSYLDLTRDSGGLTDFNILPTPEMFASGPGGSPSHYLTANGSNAAYANPAAVHMMSNHIDPVKFPSFLENFVVGSGTASPRPGNLSRLTSLPNYCGAGSPTMAADPQYLQHFRAAEAARLASYFDDPLMEAAYVDSYYVDLLHCRNAHLGALPFVGKSAGVNLGWGNLAFGLGYSGSPLASPILPSSPARPGSPLQHVDHNRRFPSGIRNSDGAVHSWHSDLYSNMHGNFVPTLLEEFKNNKNKCDELSEISGHVVAFSADQYGSRFIQQKLETATAKEKNMVFEEIMPCALTLMTDVFGNYVVQKFFEHGSATQIRELANQLAGHVLAFSLQMYGCRVIQKAIEVVDLDQQTKIVTELDGHVMRCVRDQNGNHVIQKCIECIPQEAIQFIISTFYDQVVVLSIHPYGCRVIQRVLEHCDDPKTQRIMMDEILQSVCLLAQDQYGNYVVQHVLEHGKPHERSAVIEKLSGQIVQMSQQKFASNVIEKCLAFGNPFERQNLINEVLGSTDENEPLQAMMKDQFANYVVQKVLETCNDQQREVILTKIKTHLNSLKKYTYGKHIVARVEKLVAAGERYSSSGV